MTLKNEGYNGNPSLRKAGMKQGWTVEQIVEWQKCSEDIIYFVEKYMKIVHVEHGKVDFKLYPYQKKMLKTFKQNRFTIVTTARQAGKALPLDTPIITPDGWKTMEQIQEGDYVIDHNGLPTLVTAISPIFENHDCYRVNFDDGTYIDCDENHLWTVMERGRKSYLDKKITKTAKELFDSIVSSYDSRNKLITKYYIPNTKPIKFTKKDTMIDPYTLGLWLGDGSSADGRFTSHKDDLEIYSKYIPYNIGHNQRKSDTIYTVNIEGLNFLLKQENIRNNKHIPINYLFNDIETRISLLQGLMDTAGWVDKNGSQHIHLSNKYNLLIQDIKQLLNSLGIKVRSKLYEKTNSTRLSFNVSREQFDVFRLPRKLEKQIKIHTKPNVIRSRTIISINKIESVKTKCISVDNEDHLYLAGKQMVPTHNSTTTCAFILWYILFNDNARVGLLANKESTAQEILSRIQYAYELLPKWLQQGVKEWNKQSFYLENDSFVVSAATSASSIRGLSLNLVFIDEAAFIDSWDEFYTSTFPVITSGKSTKMILVSTPNGMNHFYEIWAGANAKPNPTNTWKPVEVKWHDVPGRDEAWKEEVLSGLNWNYEKFRQENECVFGDSLITLFDTEKNEYFTITIEKAFNLLD